MFRSSIKIFYLVDNQISCSRENINSNCKLAVEEAFNNFLLGHLMDVIRLSYELEYGDKMKEERK